MIFLLKFIKIVSKSNFFPNLSIFGPFTGDEKLPSIHNAISTEMRNYFLHTEDYTNERGSLAFQLDAKLHNGGKEIQIVLLLDYD